MSSKSRTEVKAEIAQAAAALEFVKYTNGESATPRDRVIAETRAAYDQGLPGLALEFVEHVNGNRADVRDCAFRLQSTRS